MKKLLFFIPSMVGGGAEKVLVNLVNNMNYEKFDITVLALEGGGVNHKYLNNNIKYKCIFKKHIKGLRILLKFFSPKLLFKFMVKEKYDCIISYHEGPSARIVSGCNYNTKLITWIHTENKEGFYAAFRNYNEVISCYKKYNKIICVSDDVKNSFNEYSNNEFNNVYVIKNINNPFTIIDLSQEEIELEKKSFRIITVGRLDKNKNQARLIPMIDKLNKKGIDVELLILGIGEEEQNIKNLINEYNLQNVHMLGYQENPYKYFASSDLYVCCSHMEGYSTTTVESVILNIPVLTTNCSGMKDILDNGKYGIIVDDDDEKMYNALLDIVVNEKLYYDIKNNQIERIKELKENFNKSIEVIEEIF